MDDVNDDMNHREWLDEWIQLRSEFGDAVVDALALSAAAAPPASLKDRILSRIASDSELPARPASLPPGGRRILPGVSAVLVADVPWMPAALPGLDFKILNRDDARGYTTRLLRFAPGSTYPSHRHGGIEEVFIVAGSVSLNGVMLHTGDYCRSEPGTLETAAFSEEGGMAIIVSSDADEFVSAEG
jgi:quercetin dioxygenase-like cupin family protein